MSSAFRPKGVNASRGVGGRREVRDYPRDRLAIVNGYDLNRGVMLATEKDTNLKLEITIQQRQNANPAPATAARRTTEIKWSGNKIDALMAESLVEGTWVILESCRGSERISRGKESVLPVAARWVINVAEPNDDKCFTGVFTLKAYKDAIENVQRWDEKAISSEDTAALDAFAAELDDVNEKFQRRERPIRRGFQFRIVKLVEPATEGSGGRPGRPAVKQVVNLSYPIDWINSESDNPEDFGTPPTGAQFREYVNGYIDYIWGTEEGAENPQVAAFPPEELATMSFEIATYRLYRGADPKINDRMNIAQPEPGQFASRLYEMGNTPMRYSFDDVPVVGKNLAVRGICQLINNSFDKKSNPPQIIFNHMVRQLFTNGPVGHVHTMIASPDGARITVHPDLDRKRENRAENAGANAGAGDAGGNELSQSPTDVLSGVDTPFAEEADGGSFLGAGEDAFTAAAAATPAPAEDAAATPAPAPAAEASGERFRRRGGGV